MHVSPAAFRAVRRDGVMLHFALLDDIAYVLADFPASGSRGTFAEAWCEDPHWAFAVRGGLEIELAEERHAVGPGTAFYVPPAVPHRLLVAGNTRLAGFSRVPAPQATEDRELERAGFEIVRPARPPSAGTVAIQPARPEPPPAPGDVLATTRQMGEMVFTRARFGPRAGYTSTYCDLPHWGLVTAGSLAIEWEDDVEVVTAGDVFRCPAGPPGHRLQAADPATIVDFTPLDAFRDHSRVANWRRPPVDARQALPDVPPRVELVALA